MTIFFEIAVALVLAAACGIFFHLLKQPTIVGFIFAGLVIGFLGGKGSADNFELVEGLSSIGVALLLFIIGLEMNFRELKSVGLPSIIVGIGQILITFSSSFWIVSAIGFSTIVSFYMASAFTFSSTVIVVKILSEKKDLKSLYGRIAVGFLLFQDVFAILILIFLSGFQAGSNGFAANFIITLLKGAVFVAMSIGLSKVLPKFLDFIGGAPELLYLFSLAWAVGMGALFASPWVGLSVEVGGFLAGISLANSSEHFQISAKMKPLRDFFLIILFMGLGAKLFFGGGVVPFGLAALFSAFAIVGNPIIVFFIMVLLRYRARTAFLASLTTIPMSEFSFVIMFMGERLHHVSPSDVSLVAVVAIASISASSYLIIYGNQIYKFLRPALKLFEFKKGLAEEKGEETHLEGHIVLIGVHRMGLNILKALSASGEDFVAVDFDPRIIESLREVKLPAFYGDITDPEIQELVSLDKARVIISTIPDFKDNAALLHYIKKNNPGCKTILTADSEHEAEDLYEMKADYVLLPHFVGGLEISDLIVKDRSLFGLKGLRERDFKIIQKSID